MAPMLMATSAKEAAEMAIICLTESGCRRLGSVEGLLSAAITVDWVEAVMLVLVGVEDVRVENAGVLVGGASSNDPPSAGRNGLVSKTRVDGRGVWFGAREPKTAGAVGAGSTDWSVMTS